MTGADIARELGEGWAQHPHHWRMAVHRAGVGVERKGGIFVARWGYSREHGRTAPQAVAALASALGSRRGESATEARGRRLAALLTHEVPDGR